MDKIFTDYTKGEVPEDIDFYEKYLNEGYFLDPPLRYNTKIQSKKKQCPGIL